MAGTPKVNQYKSTVGLLSRSGSYNSRIDQFVSDNPEFVPQTQIPNITSPRSGVLAYSGPNFIDTLATEAQQFLGKKAADKAAADKAAAEKAAADQAAIEKAAADKALAYSSPSDLGNNAKTPAKRKVVASANNALKAAGATGFVGATNNDASVLLKILLGQ